MRAKLKRVVIHPEVFFLILKNESAWRVSLGIPKSATLKGACHDPHTNSFNLFVEDDSFPEVVLNTAVPILETEFLRLK